MPDFHGPIQHVTIAGTLWLLVALPALASLFAARFALVRRIDARANEAVAIVSVGAVAMSAAIAAYHAWVLVSCTPDERFLVQHCWRLVRVGQLDASFDLALDPLSSTLSLVVTGVGLAIVVYAASSLKNEARYARFFAWLNALAAAMLLLVLADNLLVMFFGWEGVALCSWGLLGFGARDGDGHSEPRRSGGSSAFLVGRIGDAGLLLGIALFYWGFGGTWVEGDYAPDLNARFASVEVRTAAEGSDGDLAAPPSPGDDDDEGSPALPAMTGDGSLTLTSYAGAVVFMDDARTPLKSGRGDVLRSPFVAVPVRGGVHSFRVHPGAGLDDFLVTHVAFGGGREIALTPFGPTVSFREARDQLAARDARGKATVREALLAKRGWGATGLVTLASLLLFLGVVATVVQLPLFAPIPAGTIGAAPASAILQACTLGTAGVYLMARLGFFFALSPAACSVVVVAGAWIALSGAVAGLHAYSLPRIVAASAVAQLGLMVLAVGVSGYAGAVFHLVCSALCTALLVLAAGTVSHALRDVVSGEPGPDDIRRMGDLRRVLPKTAWAYAVGCLALTAAPVPGLAGFWSRDEVLVRVLTARSLAVPGYAAFFVALLATALTAFSLWRSYYLLFVGAPRTVLARVREPSGAVIQVAMTLAAACGLVGLAVGVSPRLLGKEGQSPFEDWLAPALRGGEASMVGGSALVEWGALFAMGLAAAAGWAFARARYEHRGADWEAREAASPVHALSATGLGLLTLLDRTIAPLAAFASELTAEIDQRVVDGFVNGAALATRALAWILGRVDDDLVDGTVRALSRGALRAGARAQVARNGRVQTYVYVLVLGILALALLPYWLR